MVPTTPNPTPRLLRAAEAEREQLASHRQQLIEARETLRAELDRIETSLEEVSARESLLDRLVGASVTEEPESDRSLSASLSTQEEADDGLRRLRGPDIRREAVRLLLTQPGHPEALHYRDWYSLVREAGYAAGGKDPLATFLTQLSRSPAVRKSTQAGVYELDRDALRRLRRRRDEVNEQLGALTAPSSLGAEGSAIRSRRTELNNELGRVEKALEEVEELFEFAGEPALAA